MMVMFAHSLQGDASCWLHECFPEKSITSLAKFFEIFLKQWHYDGNDIKSFDAKSFIKTNLKYFFPWKEFHTEYPEICSSNMVYNTQHSEIHYDPIESVHEEPLVEKIVEDPPHVTSTENSDDWECFHDYFSDDDHNCTPDLLKDETIAESYSETYDENRNVHDGTPTCSPYNDDSLEDLLPCSHFSEEDEYENEDKYNLDHDTSDKDSLMSDKDVEEES